MSHSPSPTTQQTRFALPAERVSLLIACRHKASHSEVFTLVRKARTDKYTEEVEVRYVGYTVYDRHYEKLGEVDVLFLDENDQPEYLGVKMGFLGSRTTLIPFQMARVNDARQVIKVAADKETLKNGPTFDDATVRSPPSSRTRSTPTTALSVLPPSSTAAPTQPTVPSRAPRERAALRRPVGRRTTSPTSWTKPPGEAGAGESTARRPPPRKWGSLAPGESRRMSGTSGPSPKSVASRK